MLAVRAPSADVHCSETSDRDIVLVELGNTGAACRRALPIGHRDGVSDGLRHAVLASRVKGGGVLLALPIVVVGGRHAVRVNLFPKLAQAIVGGLPGRRICGRQCRAGEHTRSCRVAPRHRCMILSTPRCRCRRRPASFPSHTPATGHRLVLLDPMLTASPEALLSRSPSPARHPDSSRWRLFRRRDQRFTSGIVRR